MNRTTNLQAVTCFLLSCLTMHSLLAGDPAEQKAQQSAERWLALADNGTFTENWKSASPMLQQSVSQEKWSAALDQVRKPLGALTSRKLSTAKREKSLPGAPDGDYVVMQFQTSFANKKEATETVTATLDKDGTWKIAGYFIK
jgi:hypothetical protein